MNCWNTLRAGENHNVAGNGERDGLKISRIGQSAAKRLSGFKPFDFEPKFFNDSNVCVPVVASPARSEFLKLQADDSLFSLSAKMRQDESKDVSGGLVSPDDLVGCFAGFEDSFFNRSVKFISKKFDGRVLAHGDFEDDAVLVADMAAIRGESVNHDAAFAINNSGKVRNRIRAHGRCLRRRPFNDYAERQYSQAAGRMRSSYHTGRVNEIVSSARKLAAARKGGAGKRACAKIKAYLGDDYYAIAWPTTLRTFKNNLETIHQYSDTGFKLIMNGEIGRYENVRYIEQTNIAKGTGSDGVTTTAWTNSLSDWMFFFGNDTVAEAIAVPEEMRGKIPTDYGRSKGVAWYYLGGFGIVHASSTVAGNARIVKWDSAA